jgi:rare lipoprotein A
MKHWLAALAVFAACACHVDIAAAQSHSPTLWQRIVSVFAPRPPVRHPAGQHQSDDPQKVAAQAKPMEALPTSAGMLPQPAGEPERVAALAPTPDPAPAAPPIETASGAEPSPAQLQAAPAAAEPSAQAAELGDALPAAESPPAVVQPGAAIPVAAAKPSRKHEHRDKAKARSHADTTAALPPSASANITQQPVTALAEPSEPPSTVASGAAPAQFKPTKKAKHNKAAPGYELASLGSPGLKAALAPESTQPETAPQRFDGSAFPPAPSHGSVCNTGRKVITAYYWEGSHTASGQPFNPHAMTAAHRTLPFGTHLNVTNPRTGQSVEVIVNDRGPYVSGVGLDLSIGAAQAIGLHGTGSVCIL